MAKFKKITTKYMYIISAVVMFFSALFYPLESFRADVSSSAKPASTFSFNYGYNYSDMKHTDFGRLPFVPLDIHEDLFEQNDDYRYFYALGPAQFAFRGESTAYAYKIIISTSNMSLNYSNIKALNCYISNSSQLSTLEGLVAGSPTANGAMDVYWLVNDFMDGCSYYFSHLILAYEHTDFNVNNDTWEIYYPSVSYNAVVTLTVTPYAIEDLQDEIYLTLQNIYSNNQQMLSKLEQIYTSVDTVETKLQSLVSIAEQIESNTDELEGLLQTCNSYLASIKTELEEQTTWLERIWNTLVDYFDTSNSQQDKVDDFANNSNQQSGSLDNLVGDMNELEKPSVNDSVSDIDKIIPNGEGFVFDVLRTVTDLSIVGDMLLLTVTMAFVAYVLFGKR